MVTFSNPAYLQWLNSKKAHTCSCGHVQWAHWENGKCAHCACVKCDAKPMPAPFVEETL